VARGWKSCVDVTRGQYKFRNSENQIIKDRITEPNN